MIVQILIAFILFSFVINLVPIVNLSMILHNKDYENKKFFLLLIGTSIVINCLFIFILIMLIF